MSRCRSLLYLSFSTNSIFFSCQCTESRVSSSHRHQHRVPRRRRPHRSRAQAGQSGVPLSTFTSTSYRSDSPSDVEEEEEISMMNQDETQYLSAVSNLMGHLPPPDLVQSTMGDEYCHHLQKMADLSNQQRFDEQSMPFFGQDDHSSQTEHSSMPTSSMEKTLSFH